MKAEELISILIELSKVDNHFDSYEFTYILNVGEELGLSQAKIERLIHTAALEEYRIPRKEEDRMTILYYLLFLMKIDANITEQEKSLVHHYGFKLGFSKAMIDDFIEVVERYSTTRVPVDEMLAIIKKYKN